MKINEMGKTSINSVEAVPVGGVFENQHGALFLKVDDDTYLLIKSADFFLSQKVVGQELYWDEPGDPPLMHDITTKNTTVKTYYGILYRVDEITVVN